MSDLSETSVLVIDDNDALAENIAEILDDYGVEVEVALNAADGLARFDEREWSLVVTDVRMPGMNGLELLAQLKQRRPGTPVMVMTGYADTATVERAHESGALAVVHKPLDLDAFLHLVERVAEASAPILVVDDDVALVGNLSEILCEETGLLPHPATSIALARHLAQGVDFRVALVDLRLPDGDGLALARELQHRPDGSSRPVVVITGYPEALEDDADAELPDAAPSNDGSGKLIVVTKPFTVPKLVERLRQIV